MDAPGVPQPTIGQFCAKVCGWVRFWPDHDAITAELTAHLEDHRDVLLERNPALSQAEAEAQAVAAMGDPEALGRELDKSHNPLPGWFQILFRVSVRTALILLLVFCFLPKATDLYDLIAAPPLYNDDDTGVIVEHYDQVEVLADYRPEHAVCYLEHYTFSAERVLVTPREHSVTGESALRVSVLLKAVHLNPSLRCPRISGWLWAEDDLGNRYPGWNQYDPAELLHGLYPEQAAAPELYTTMGGPSLQTPFVTYYDVYVIDVDPEAVQLTLRFDRYGKIQLSFPLSLKGGGADV